MNPEPQTMKPFDPTKPAQYRNGEPARILCKDGKNKVQGIAFPIVTETIKGVLLTHKITGENLLHMADNYDLVNVPVKRKLTGWVNVYSYRDEKLTLQAHETKDLAASFQSPNRIACLDLSKYNIEFEEGEGL